MTDLIPLPEERPGDAGVILPQQHVQVPAVLAHHWQVAVGVWSDDSAVLEARLPPPQYWTVLEPRGAQQQGCSRLLLPALTHWELG